MPRYQPNQSLNEWVRMLHNLYGHSQNYSKTAFKVHAHLTEVAGAMGRLVLRKRDIATAGMFAAKTFAWAVALLARIRPTELDLEDILLRKFPGMCPYCRESPCKCWMGTKPSLDEEKVREAFFRRRDTSKRTPNDFQLMFRRIYEQSWEHDANILSTIVSRIFEEIAELAEALR